MENTSCGYHQTLMMAAKVPKKIYKVVAVASQCATGKTAFIQRFCQDKFEITIPTIGAAYKEKTLDINGTSVALQIWDPSGLERARVLLVAYLKCAKGIIFTYDVTNLDSFLKLTDVMAIVYQQEEEFVGIIVGLKCDAEDQREVPTAQALEFAVRHGMKLFEASALTGQNVKEVFQTLCKDLLNLEEGDPLPVLNNQKIFRRQMKMKLPRKYAMMPIKNLLHELKQLGLETSSDLQDVMKYGSYRCFWCRIFLVGQFGVGKSTLAKVLVGDPLPDARESTNGIWIYMGKAGMSIKDKEWIYMPQGNSKIETISGMLLSLNYNVNFPGYTKVNIEPQGSSDDSRTKVETEAQGSSDDSRINEALQMKEENDKSSNTADKTTSQARADFCQEQEPKLEYLTSDHEVGDVTNKSKGSGILFKEKSGEMYSSLNMLIIDAIREGKFKQKIVPFDIWDFGGQKEFYLTHQLFITSRGVFVLMFNGSKDLRVNIALMQEPFYKNTSEATYLLVWVNSILTYCPKLVNGFPKIMLVATHKDKVSLNKQEVKRKQLISSLEQLFKDHSGMAHLEFRDLLFINTTTRTTPI